MLVDLTGGNVCESAPTETVGDIKTYHMHPPPVSEE